MATVCAAFASRQLTRTGRIPLLSLAIHFIHRVFANHFPVQYIARTRFPQISRRGFLSTPFLYATESSDASSGSKVPFRPPPIKRGSLASGSIFDDVEDLPQLSTTGRMPRRRRDAAAAASETVDEQSTEVAPQQALSERDTANMERSLNPFPNRRARWQRKMVIRSIHRRGRLTRKEQIMQSERELLTKSHWFKTSLKKLGPLARQIAGKNVDEAILQMRFSKKKAAKDVKAFLEEAKNEAIVSRGMGLGQQEVAQAGEDVATIATADAPKPVHLTLKDGQKLTVTDPTAMYVSQAWVNRGPYSREYSHRGRGNIHILRPPHTSISLVLKEEKTRIRECREREEKAVRKRRAKVWSQLPNRPVTMRNQYYAW